MATDKQKAFVRLAIMERIVLHKDWHSLNSRNVIEGKAENKDV